VVFGAAGRLDHQPPQSLPIKPWPKSNHFGERIATHSSRTGLLSEGQIVNCWKQQKKEGARLIKLIIDKSYVSEQDLAVSMGRGTERLAHQPDGA